MREPVRKQAGKQAGWLYGTHAVAAALANPARRRLRLLATPGAAGRLEPGTLPQAEITERRVLDRLFGPGAVHQGVALLAMPLQQPSLAELCAGDAAGRVLLVLDQVSDPGNVGAILRSAHGFGAQAVIVAGRNAPGMSPVIARAASGAVEKIPLLSVVNIARTLGFLARRGYWCAGLDSGAPGPLPALAGPQGIVLVLGAEGRGLRPLTRRCCDHMVHIPGAGESLNVAAAAAVALYECAGWRQSRQPA